MPQGNLEDYTAVAPGDRAEVDAADTRLLPGHVYKHFTARDVVSRWDVLDVYYRATVRAATVFPDTLLERMPFPVRAIQVDGGFEFKAGFETARQELDIQLFVLPPRSTRLSAHVKRARRTHRGKFHHWRGPPDSLTDLQEKLRAYEAVHNTFWPHQALGRRTPGQFYQPWLSARAERR